VQVSWSRNLSYQEEEEKKESRVDYNIIAKNNSFVSSIFYQVHNF
jgi:hypothetical protein